MSFPSMRSAQHTHTGPKVCKSSGMKFQASWIEWRITTHPQVGQSQHYPFHILTSITLSWCLSLVRASLSHCQYGLRAFYIQGTAQVMLDKTDSLPLVLIILNLKEKVWCLLSAFLLKGYTILSLFIYSCIWKSCLSDSSVGSAR